MAYVLGLDLGATSIKSAAFRVTDGAIVGSVRRQPLGGKDLESVLVALAEAAKSTAAESGVGWTEVAAVGLSQPGAIDPATGRVAAAANFPWVDAPLREALGERLGVDVTMVEDAEAALVAELQPGGGAVGSAAAAASGGGDHVAAVLVLGGGVGSALAIGGRVHRGAHGLVEAGHLIVSTDGPACPCGQRGCLEAFASGPAIARRAVVELMSNTRAEGSGCSALDAATGGGELEARHVLEAAAAGDALAGRVLEEVATMLSVACIAISRTVDPHVLVLAGGVATPTLLKATLEAYERLAWTLLPSRMQITLATTGADAGTFGAAAAARSAGVASAAVGRSPPTGPADKGEFLVRAAGPADRAAAIRVCLLTGDEGADATDAYPTDPDALGKRWVAPYIDLEPDFAFILEERATREVVGYCLAALDTTAFAARLQAEYLPPLRAAHPDPAAEGKAEAAWSAEETVYHELHDTTAGEAPCGLDLAQYPSHVHIDLAPGAQGRRQGRRLMAAQLDALARAGSPGVFLQMHAGNARARRFYEKLGFRELDGAGGAGEAGTGGAFFMGLRLGSPA